MRVIPTTQRLEIALLCAGLIAASALLFAGHAAAADQEPAAANQADARAIKPARSNDAKVLDGWASRLQKKRDWWNRASEVLFTDIEISDEQARRVDAIIEEQLATRAQLQQRDIEISVARKSRDAERIEAARLAFAATRAELKETHEIYAELRALLSEEQQPQFDMNRARHVAENQSPARKRAKSKTP